MHRPLCDLVAKLTNQVCVPSYDVDQAVCSFFCGGGGGAWEWGESIGQPHLGWGWPKKISQLYLLCAPGFGTLSQMKCFLIYLKFDNKSIFIIQKKIHSKNIWWILRASTVYVRYILNVALHAIDIEAYNWIFFHDFVIIIISSKKYTGHWF